MVLFRGSCPCDLLLIGEAPGRSEDVLGEPFIGPAGHYLEELIAIGLKQQCRIVHLRKEEYDVCIDRTTKWGNPFRITPSISREQVIEQYTAYLQNRPDLLESLTELSDKTLGCWCKPQPCHGDVLVQLVHEKFPSPRIGITNICACLPLGEASVPDGQRPLRPPTKAEALSCRPRLLEIIEILSPKGIICLGKTAARYLPKPKEGLPSCVQFVEETIHPSALLQMHSDSPARYVESRNRCLLTLTRAKWRWWGLTASAHRPEPAQESPLDTQ